MFDLASITKVFTAVAVLQQVDRRRIDLAAPGRACRPPMRGVGPGGGRGAATPARVRRGRAGAARPVAARRRR
ncbi:MAG: serine hydrolase [Micromonosporaceae bacterium]